MRPDFSLINKPAGRKVMNAGELVLKGQSLGITEGTGG